MTDWPRWIALGVALISLFFNLWQYHRNSKKNAGLGGSMSAWWHWAIAMRDQTKTYLDSDAEKPSIEVMSGIAKGTFDGLANQTGRLAEDIAKTMVRLDFPPPWNEPWKEPKDPKK